MRLAVLALCLAASQAFGATLSWSVITTGVQYAESRLGHYQCEVLDGAGTVAVSVSVQALPCPNTDLPAGIWQPRLTVYSATGILLAQKQFTQTISETASPPPATGPPAGGGMPIDVGYDFRQTSGYVTDPSNCFPVLANVYDGTTTIGGLVAGWSTAPSFPRDRSTTVDPRLAGMNTSGSTGQYFRVNGLSGKTISIRAAFGDATGTNFGEWDLYDGDPSSGGTLIQNITNSGASFTGKWLDATGVMRTSSADWVANNAAKSHTFTNDALFVVPHVGKSSNVIAHLRLTESGGGGTTVNATVGSFTWGGLSSPLSTQINAGVGGYTWQGKSSPLITTINATIGSYTFSGLSSSLSAQINASIGGYGWSGLSAPLSAQINAAIGTWTWSGKTSSVITTPSINATVGTWTWGGQFSPLASQLNAGVGGWTMQGIAATVTTPAVQLSPQLRFGSDREFAAASDRSFGVGSGANWKAKRYGLIN